MVKLQKPLESHLIITSPLYGIQSFMNAAGKRWLGEERKIG